MDIIKRLKNKNKVICYIVKTCGKYSVRTGKPSDLICISWDYNTLEEAEKTASEYLENYLNIY